MDDEEFETITVPQLLLVGVAAVTILSVAVVWNAVSVAAAAVQAVKHRIKS